jgi:hypothetical protein
VDLVDAWQIEEAQVEQLRTEEWSVRKTSAKEGLEVEESFSELASRLLSQ